MSASFYDLLKYAATGISSPDMTYYDKMRASTLMGGATVQTLTGQPPLTFKADGTPLISWSMKGNGSQTGTPTPDNPVMPEFVGVRTANLYNISAHDTTNGYVNNAQLNSDGSTAAWGSAEISEYIPIVSGKTYTFNGIGSYNSPSYCIYDSSKQFIAGYKYSGRLKITFTAPDNASFFRFTHIQSATTAMCIEGTAIPAEFVPYGWAEKITCAGQTVPVYLGQVSTVRKIRKLVLTGEEGWNKGNYPPSGGYQFFTPKPSDIIGDPQSWIITHFTIGNTLNGSAFASYLSLYPEMSILPENATTNDFKAWLASEYAAGHPVTIWYVLATEQTGIINEPLCKIGDYADELHSEDAGVAIPTVKGANVLTVDTPIQPSEMTITFKG